MDLQKLWHDQHSLDIDLPPREVVHRKLVEQATREAKDKDKDKESEKDVEGYGFEESEDSRCLECEEATKMHNIDREEEVL